MRLPCTETLLARRADVSNDTLQPGMPAMKRNYYALILSTDSAQYMAGDILAVVCALHERLQALRAAYRVREGRELEILILSDHGNNHAGRSHRVRINTFLRE